MRMISLFAGIGGFDLGFEQAGIDTVAQVEIDSFCRKVLTHHWPDVMRFKDVKTVGKHNLPACDILTGGFPCQDVSVAGNRVGLAGKRTGLWFEFARIAGSLRPNWIVVENTQGLLSSNKGKDFAIVIQMLSEFGYGLAWRVLDSQYFGVPQRRKRVFIVGCIGDPTSAAKVLFEPESCNRNTSASKSKGQKNISKISSHSATSYRDKQEDLGKQTYIVIHDGGRIPTNKKQNGLGIRCNAPMYTLDTVSQHAVAATHGKFGIRCLTPVEYERLQGFPDNWTLVDGAKDSPRGRALGNAVTVPVARWIGERIIKANNERNGG